jgi:2-keto-3-deoxy-L-rhamnonate aldolase RhmA
MDVITIVPVDYMEVMLERGQFRSRIKNFDAVFGIFIKIPDISVIEVVAGSGLDFVVLDQEHAPLDRGALDALLFAAHSLDVPALVRVPNTDASTILAALDSGAVGILLPHVLNAGTAQRAAGACRYESGRGYSGAARSTRGRGVLADAIRAVDDEVVVVAQIEDASAIGSASDIAACKGIDALFIGRGDLAVSLHAAGSDAPEVWAAAQAIARAAAAHRKGLWGFAVDWDEAERLLELGGQAVVVGSDQSHLKGSVVSLVAEGRRAVQRLKSR